MFRRSSEQDTQEWLNYLHSETPEVGDRWHEMFMPTYTVLDINGSYILVRQDWKRDGSTELWSRDEFRGHLRYASKDMANKCMSDVVPARRFPF